MRRFLSLPILALLLVLGFAPSPAVAQPDESICVKSVWSNLPNYDADTLGLQEAMAALNSRGFDTRAIFLTEYGSGVTKGSEFERVVLRELCPELFTVVDGEVKPVPSLVMLMVSVDDRNSGTVFGGRIEPYHDQSRFADLSNDHMRNGRYAEGLTAYFAELNRRIMSASTPSPVTVQPPTQAPSGQTSVNAEEDESSGVSGTAVLVIFLVIVGFVVLALLLYFGIRIFNARRSRQAERTQMKGRVQAARTKLTELTLSEGDQLTPNLWQDRLSEEDGQGLKAARERYTTCVADCGQLIDSAERVVEAADSEESLADADNELARAEQLLETGVTARAEIEATCQDLARKDERFKQQRPAKEAAAASLKRQFEELVGRGFKVAVYLDELVTVNEAIVACQKLYDGGSLLTAYNQLEAIEQTLTGLRDTATNLPKRANRIEHEADNLASALDRVAARQREATSLADELIRQHHTDDVVGIGEPPAAALSRLEMARQNIAAARAAATMERQEFDEGDRLLANAKSEIDRAENDADTVFAVQRELKALPQQLRDEATNLQADARALQTFISDNDEDIDGNVRRVANEVEEAARQARNGLGASGNSLLAAKQELAQVRRSLDECTQEAESQHTAMQQMRQRVARRRQEAEEQLEEAGRYKSYASDEYATAGGYFNGVLTGMTLQQQLDHWDRAYEAAEQAYDEGYSNRPTYTAPSSDDDDGGSSDSSWSSSFGSSRGGSSDNSWSSSSNDSSSSFSFGGGGDSGGSSGGSSDSGW